MAEVVSSLTGKSPITVTRQFGGRQRHCNGGTFRAREYAVSTVGCEEEHLRRYLHHQEQLAIQGRDEDGAC